MNTKPDLIKDETLFQYNTLFPNITISLTDCLDKNLLVSPDGNKKLHLVTEATLGDGKSTYGIHYGCPVLYPTEITKNWHEGQTPLSYANTSLTQYTLLSQIKQFGEINAPIDSVPYLKHSYRFKQFCQELSGLILDVGCDAPSRSMKLLPSSCQYLGLDPYAGQGEFRIIGLGEILPIRDQSVDAVLFNTSLDHILDYHTAIDEAFRVLKPRGSIVIASYAWLERATLLTDSVHFHHFREYEILGSLQERFKVDDILRYEDPKQESHRYGLYVRGIKRKNL